MAKSRFNDRLVDLDQQTERFLQTVAWLGGYVIAEQAQELGIRNSVPRVHGQLKALESWGFLNRVTTYPAVYQVTKSVTRLLGADLSARRRHAIETLRTRLLAVNFYLEALQWPVKFVFDHQQKITALMHLGCDLSMLPQRAGKPYLWQDFVLQRASGDLAVAMIDHHGRNAYRQLKGVLERFGACLALAQENLKLLVVVATEARHRLFTRLLHQASLQRLLPETANDSQAAVKVYRVRRPVPAVRSLIPNDRDLRKLWALQQLGGGEQGNASPHLPRAVSNFNDAVGSQKGGESW